MEKQKICQIEKIGLSVNFITWQKKKIFTRNLIGAPTFIEKPGL
jgi:hypothetical protein